MLREISEEVRVNLKDRLREARHTIRKHRHDATPPPAGARRAPFPFRELEGLFSHAVSAFDDVMTMAESLVPIGPRGSGAGLVQPFGAYFLARDAIAGERAFRRDLYRLMKSVLTARQLDGAYVSERSLAATHEAFLKQQETSLAALEKTSGWSDRIAAVAALSAALLIELVRHQPLRFTEGSLPIDDREMATACLAPIALACGLATMEAGKPPEGDLLEIATLATDARMERIVAAVNGKEAEAELTTLFATLLAHLP